MFEMAGIGWLFLAEDTLFGKQSGEREQVVPSGIWSDLLAKDC